MKTNILRLPIPLSTTSLVAVFLIIIVYNVTKIGNDWNICSCFFPVSKWRFQLEALYFDIHTQDFFKWQFLEILLDMINNKNTPLLHF